MAMRTLSTTNWVPLKDEPAHLQVFVLWGCFLGLQLGKSRFPRCSAPYFVIFAVQVLAALLTSASRAYNWQQVPATGSFPCQRVQGLRHVWKQACAGGRVHHLPSLTVGAGLQSQGAFLLQAALSLAANVLFTYQARRTAAAAARQASAQPMLRPQVPPLDPVGLTLSPGDVGCPCCRLILLAWCIGPSVACRDQLAWPTAMRLTRSATPSLLCFERLCTTVGPVCGAVQLGPEAHGP